MKKRFWILIAIVILILLVYILKNIDFYEVYNLLKKINLFYFGLAFFSCLISFLLWNLRFQYSLHKLVKGSYWFMFSVLLTGVFFNTITPGANVGGEPVRAYFLNKKYKKPKTKFLGGILADKFFNTFVFLFFVIFSLLFVLFLVKIPSNLKILLEVILLGLFLLVGIFIFLARKKMKNSLNWIYIKLYLFKAIKKRFRTFEKFKKYSDRRINNLINIFKDVVSNKKIFWYSILISIVIWVFIYLISYFLFLSFEVEISILSIVIVVTLGYLVGDLSPVPGGIGVMESVMFLLYSAMGIAPALAVVVALLSRIIFYFYSLLIGGLCLIYLRSTLK